MFGNQFIKMQMHTGAIVTGKTLNSRREAETENEKLIASGDTYRWVNSFKEMEEFEHQATHKIIKDHVKDNPMRRVR